MDPPTCQANPFAFIGERQAFADKLRIAEAKDILEPFGIEVIGLCRVSAWRWAFANLAL